MSLLGKRALKKQSRITAIKPAYLNYVPGEVQRKRLILCRRLKGIPYLISQTKYSVIPFIEVQLYRLKEMSRGD